MGILDSTCMKTVTDKTWLNVFFDILMDKEKRLIDILQLTQNSNLETEWKLTHGKSKIISSHWKKKRL